MHISNEQGKTIKVVVIWISSEAIVPTEAQLYGVVSRIISRRGMKTIEHDENGEQTLKTRNISVQRGA